MQNNAQFSTHEDQTHEAIAVEVITSMPDSDCLKQQSSQQRLSINPPQMNT